MSITIISKREGFRRGGMAHPAKPTTYPDDKFTAEQLAAIKAEPMLVVTLAEDEKDTKADAKAKADADAKAKADADAKNQAKK